MKKKSGPKRNSYEEDSAGVGAWTFSSALVVVGVSLCLRPLAGVAGLAGLAGRA